jgi:Peptidase family M28
MNGSTRTLSPSLVVVALLGTILFLFPHRGLCLEQSEEDQRSWLRAPDTLSSERMLADVRALSDPSFNGRQSGSADDLRSAYWVADQFRASKISLASIPLDRLNDPVNVPTGFMSKPHQAAIIAPEPILQISTGKTSDVQHLGTDFLPILDSPSAHARAPIVFVGYGIVDAASNMNDYAGVDVNNCIVLFLRGKPDHFNGTISHADKVRIAYQKGAVAYLTATGPVLTSYEIRRGVTGQPSAYYGLSPAPGTLPGAWINTILAEQIVGGIDHSNQETLRSLQERLHRTYESRSFRTKYLGTLAWNTRQEQGALINVIAVFPGTDPELRHEAIVIGAHRDHFGRQAGLLFSGADDNASGTAVMLEVARLLTKAGVHHGRTILFISFSGEEQGLAGSRLYMDRPLVSATMTKAMINIDHAGVGNGRLTVGVTGLEKSVALDAGRTAGLADKLDLFGFFPGGDHVPFKEAGVPTVTIVSGGIHPHFHQPTDTPDTINPEILHTVAQYVLALAWQLTNVQ